MGLDQLTTEARNPASSEIDRLSSLEIVRLMNAEDAKIPPSIGAITEQIAAAVDAITDRMRTGGRLIYIGAGTSGRLGVLDASECPPTFNTPPWQVVGVIAGGPAALTRAIEGAEDYPDLAVQDLKKLSLAANDVVVGIASSGRTPYVIGGLKHANEIGAFTVGLACNEGSELAAVSRVMLTPVVGPEVVTGSTRLKAGTATKLILNMLTTATMIRLGKTYGDLMVDLAATNLKLEDRSRRIVAALADVTPDKAGELLKESHGDVKSAIVMQRHGVTEAQARGLLAGAAGQLRVALASTVTAEPQPVAATKGSGDRLVIGVDGGGSKTLAWLARLPAGVKEVGELTPIGEGEAGGSNPNSLGWAAAMANIELSVTRAFHAAGLPKQPALAICLGIAGAGRDAEQHRLRTWVDQRRLAERIHVTHDVSPLLSVPGLDGHGIALVAGTGSLAYGRTPDGRTARSGGFGYLLGDEGSGYHIALEGLRAALRAVDGRGPETSMTRGFQSRLQVNSTAHFIHRFYEQAEDRTWIAGMASVVLAAAQSGDEMAAEIVQTNIDDLATMVATVGVQLMGSTPTPYPLALAGGLIANSAFLRVGVLKRLDESGLTPSKVVIVTSPVAGTLRLAAMDALAAESRA